MAVPLLRRGLPLFRLSFRQTVSPLRRPFFSLVFSKLDRSEEVHSSSTIKEVKETSKVSDKLKNPNHNAWKDDKDRILRDIDPIVRIVKDILHSSRYMDGERLRLDDEKAVVEKLLAHHPCSEDKIGCGLDSIMVDRHTKFRACRCLFVVRTDGSWIDFSYQKCLLEYVRKKYPLHAERFGKETKKLVAAYTKKYPFHSESSGKEKLVATSTNPQQRLSLWAK